MLKHTNCWLVEFKTTLVYKVSSTTASAMQRSPVFKNKQTTQKSKQFKEGSQCFESRFKKAYSPSWEGKRGEKRSLAVWINETTGWPYCLYSQIGAHLVSPILHPSVQSRIPVLEMVPPILRVGLPENTLHRPRGVFLWWCIHSN